MLGFGVPSSGRGVCVGVFVCAIDVWVAVGVRGMGVVVGVAVAITGVFVGVNEDGIVVFVAVTVGGIGVWVGTAVAVCTPPIASFTKVQTIISPACTESATLFCARFTLALFAGVHTICASRQPLCVASEKL